MNYKLLIAVRFVAVTFALALALNPAITLSDIIWISTDQNRILRVDVQTGTVVESKYIPTISSSFGGPVGIYGSWTDLAFSPSGVLYGISELNLFEIDYAAGAARDIGQLRTDGTGSSVGFARGIVFDTNGTLFVGFHRYSAVPPLVHTVNINTGAVTSLATQPTSAGDIGDLAIIGNNLILSTSRLTAFDLSTAPPNERIIGSLGLFDITGLASPDRATLYGVGGKHIYSIDPNTAKVSAMSQFSSSGFATGAAFENESLSAVPEPSILISSFLFGLLCLIWNRKNCIAVLGIGKSR